TTSPSVLLLTPSSVTHYVNPRISVAGAGRPIHNHSMKITDHYDGKFEIWAREGKVVRMPRLANLPRFGHRRFDSYEELNAWKQSLRDELLKQGGAQWTK
ncbi:MAG: hypothetical protein WCL49_07370, partial [bacterium]